MPATAIDMKTDSQVCQIWKFEARRAKEKKQNDSRKESAVFVLKRGGDGWKRTNYITSLYILFYLKLTK